MSFLPNPNIPRHEERELWRLPEGWKFQEKWRFSRVPGFECDLKTDSGKLVGTVTYYQEQLSNSEQYGLENSLVWKARIDVKSKYGNQGIGTWILVQGDMIAKSRNSAIPRFMTDLNNNTFLNYKYYCSIHGRVIFDNDKEFVFWP